MVVKYYHHLIYKTRTHKVQLALHKYTSNKLNLNPVTILH